MKASCRGAGGKGGSSVAVGYGGVRFGKSGGEITSGIMNQAIASQSVRGRAGGGRRARVRLTHEASDFLAV